MSCNSWAKRVRCVPRLRTDCTVLYVQCLWVYFPHTPSISRNSFDETAITTISQMLQVAMTSNSFVIAKRATAKLKMKMKMLPAGFSVALCNTTIQFCDRHSNRSFLLLRIADFVVDPVDVVDVSVSEFVLSPPSEHLAFHVFHILQVSIVSSVIFLLHDVPKLSDPSEDSSDEFLSDFCTNLPKYSRC